MVRNYQASSAPSSVTLAGRTLLPDRDFVVTVDTAVKRLWLTLLGNVKGAATLAVTP